jgi:putative lipoic acid-binding regulatory protein
MSKESEFYKKLKVSLEETSTFPTEYMFKFIVPADGKGFEKVEGIFNNLGAVIKTKPSKTGKYTSLTIMVQMKSSDAIIDKYKEVSTIEGIISL